MHYPKNNVPFLASTSSSHHIIIVIRLDDEWIDHHLIILPSKQTPHCSSSLASVKRSATCPTPGMLHEGEMGGLMLSSFTVNYCAVMKVAGG